MGPTRSSVLAVAFVVGVLLGYLLVPLSESQNGTAPRVEWAAIMALAVIAGILLVFAYSTYRTVHRERLLMDPRRAVNFLLLAKASALMGALIAGGYLGFGWQFVDQMDIQLPRERVIHSVIAAAASVLIVLAGLLLERACRVPKGGDDNGKGAPEHR